MGHYARHFFVCQTQRPPFGKPSCGQRGSAELLNALTEAKNARPDLWPTVQVSAAGCLGPCFYGPAIVVYPEGTWYAPVTSADVSEIIESHLIGGVPVERLRFIWPAI